MARFTLTEPNNIRGDQLIDEINQATPASLGDHDLTFYPPQSVEIRNFAPATEQQIAAIVAQHNAQDIYFDRDLEVKQRNDAQTLIKQYLVGLGQLDIVDFGYAYIGRLFAAANEESLQTILGIDSRATAQSYITGLSQWQNLTVAQRQWLALDLESRAYDAMVTRIIIRS